MRTLHSDLTASQQAASATPYMRVTFSPRDGSAPITHETTDSPNLFRHITAAEGFFGGSLGQITLSDGRVVPFAAVVQLDNANSAFTSVDYRGHKVKIGWGFNTASGNKYSEGESYWVVVQRETSLGGRSVVDFICVSSFVMLELQKIQARGLTSVPYKNITSNLRHIMIDALTDNPTKVFADDGGSFTDETADAIDDGANDVAPLPATPAVNDAFYIGGGNAVEFDRVTVEITTAEVLGGASHTILWEYYNGSAWASLTLETDDNGAGSASTWSTLSEAIGVKVLAFVNPTNWANVAVNGTTGRWIRGRVTVTSGTPSTRGLLGRVGVSTGWGLNLGTTDSVENALVVNYEAEFLTSRLDILRSMLDYTHLSLVAKTHFFEVSDYTDAPGSTDYAYSLASGHTFIDSFRERELVIPNRLTVFSNTPGETGTLNSQVTNAASQADIGIVDFIIVQDDATQGEIDGIAERMMERFVQEQFQGTIVAPMNVGQEIWDWIGVTDSRNSVTYTGRVGSIIREYKPRTGLYRISVTNGIDHFGVARNHNLTTVEGATFVGVVGDVREGFNDDTVIDIIMNDAGRNATANNPAARIVGERSKAPGDGRSRVVKSALVGTRVELKPDGLHAITADGTAGTPLIFRDETGNVYGHLIVDDVQNRIILQTSGSTGWDIQLNSDADIHLDAPSGDIKTGTDIISGGHIIPSADSTFNLGSASVRYANGYFDSIAVAAGAITTTGLAVTLTAGEALVAGNVVWLSAASTVKKTTTSIQKQHVIGVVQANADSAADVLVQIAGLATVTANEAIAIGDVLIISDSSAGRVEIESGHNHGSVITSAAGSSHTHTIAAHLHAYGTINSVALSGSTADTGAGGSHVHAVGSLDAAAESSHTHDAVQGSGDIAAAALTANTGSDAGGGSHVHVMSHSHAITGDTDAGTSHDHAISGSVAAESSHVHSYASPQAHDHAIEGSTANTTATAGNESSHQHTVTLALGVHRETIGKAITAAGGAGSTLTMLITL